MDVYSIFIPLLVLIAVIATGGAVLMYRGRSSTAVRMRINETNSNASSAESVADRGMVETIERAATAVSVGKPSPKLREELARAGYFTPNAASVYLGLKTLIFLGSLAGLTAIVLPLGAAVAPTMGAVLLVSTLLSFVPNIVLSVRRGSRAGEIRRHLPDALDLLEICVSSGMGLDTAWNSVAEEMREVSSALAEEMALTSLQLRLGASRSVAMRTMAERTGVDDVSSLVAVLVQSERFGTSISEALRTFAASMRDRRSQNAAEAAEKTAVKLLFPMVIFIFPTVFVVTAGPAAIQLYRMISGRP